MGRRKPFIDKKSATTYSLLYNDTEEAGEDASAARNIEHVSAKVDHAAVIAQLQGRQQEGPVLQLPEERRRELVSLGFPDDGYDYLKHLKEGREDVRVDHEDDSEGITSRDEAPAASGPRVFLPAPYVEPPPEDIKVIDARRLPPQQQAHDEEDVFETLREVAAFSRNIEEEEKFKGGREIKDLNQMMSEIEREDDENNAEGHGDLLDDFVSSALVPAPRRRPASQKLATVPESEGEDMSSEGVYDDSASSLSDHSHADLHGGGLMSHGNRRGSSIASTYWRPERTDRTEISSVLDDRFEQLALDYDSDDLGDLDEQPGGGGASLDDFDALLSECLAEQQSSPYIKASGNGHHSGSAPSGSALHTRQQDDAPHVAVAKAKELVMSGMLRDSDDAGLVEELQPSACNWDCETVLSNYSNIDNHPGVLHEPSGRSRPPRWSRNTHPEAATGMTSLANSAQASKEAGAGPSGCQTNTRLQRSKTETAEEKRQRKQLVREARRQARIKKKNTKELYTESALSIKLDPMHKQRVIAA
ncbi:g4890 [Coccomyxa viridis]|uniref:G4890 protein n=1 Tax=Coccomyxa viridis TaxID=1274662 RepID=A0ABP1FRE7_9CHLO